MVLEIDIIINSQEALLSKLRSKPPYELPRLHANSSQAGLPKPAPQQSSQERSLNIRNLSHIIQNKQVKAEEVSKLIMNQNEAFRKPSHKRFNSLDIKPFNFFHPKASTEQAIATLSEVSAAHPSMAEVANLSVEYRGRNQPGCLTQRAEIKGLESPRDQLHLRMKPHRYECKQERRVREGVLGNSAGDEQSHRVQSSQTPKRAERVCPLPQA